MSATHRAIVWPLAACLIAACTSGVDQSAEPARKKEPIFGKLTQDIGVFDPNANQVVSDQKIQATDPITAPLSAYGPTMEKVSIIAVEHAINLFYATEGRYPANHQEFMEKIIKANGIKLPVLPYGGEYKYDEANHALVAVYPKKEQK